MSGSVFNTCVATLGEEVSDRDLLECVAVGFSEQSGTTDYVRSVLLVLCAALIFFMQAGFAM
jgi:hypothetical protein